MSSAWEFGEARPTLHMFIQVSARPFCRGHLPCKANMMFNLNPNRIQCCWNKTKQALIIYNIIYCNSIMIIVIIVITCNNYTHIILIKNDNKLGNSLTPSTATSTGDLTRSSQSSAAGPHSSLPGGQATRQVSWDFTQETMGFWGFSEKTHGKKLICFLKSIKSSIIQFRFKSIIFIPKSNGHRYSHVLRIPHFQTQPDRESQRDQILLVMSVQL